LRKRKGGYTGDNPWQVRFETPEGVERAENFRTKPKATKRLNAIEADKERGSFVDPAMGRITFAGFVDLHYRQTMVALEPSTRARDESYLRTHILPVFGTKPIAAIDYTACQAWVSELSTRRAPATAVKAAQIASKVFKAAVKSKVIVVNPMAEVTLPKVERGEDWFLTPAQVQELAEAMTIVAPRLRAFVWLGCYGGPRIGELLALRWSDIDFLRRTVTIQRKVIEIQGVGLVEGRTKTAAGRRTVTLPRAVMAELEAHRAAYGSAGAEDLVFRSADGAPTPSEQPAPT